MYISHYEKKEMYMIFQFWKNKFVFVKFDFSYTYRCTSICMSWLELSHYCLAGNRRRQLDDFGYWYFPCGRTTEEQVLFEQVEARPQGLEKAMCEAIGIKFSPSLDDFSGRPPATEFLDNLESVYQEMTQNPPPTAQKVLVALATLKPL